MLTIVRFAAGGVVLAIAALAPAVEPTGARAVSPPQRTDVFGIPSSGSVDALDPLLNTDLMNPYVREAMKPINPESTNSKTIPQVDSATGMDSLDRLGRHDSSGREEPTPITELLTGKRWQPAGDDDRAFTLLLGDGETTGKLALEVGKTGSAIRTDTTGLTRTAPDGAHPGNDDPGHLEFVGSSVLNVDLALEDANSREVAAMLGLLGAGFLAASGHCNPLPCPRERSNHTSFDWTSFGQVKS